MSAVNTVVPTIAAAATIAAAPAPATAAAFPARPTVRFIGYASEVTLGQTKTTARNVAHFGLINNDLTMNCESWDWAEELAAEVKQGDRVKVSGFMRSNTYTDKDTGEEVTANRLVVTAYAVLDSKAEREARRAALKPVATAGVVDADEPNHDIAE